MKKIKINKLPKGYHRMPDGTIMRDSDHMQFGGNTISQGPGPYNLEAEGGETIVTDKTGNGLPELYNISGKRHSQGGVKMNESAGSFIFSDTPKMKLGRELNKFFGKPDTRSYTPAELSKKYIDMNDDKLTVMDENADRFAKASAEMNMFNKTYKLGGLAMAQEAKKGFEDGIPQIAGLYATLNGIPTGQDTFPSGGMQSAKYGAELRKYQEEGQVVTDMAPCPCEDGTESDTCCEGWEDLIQQQLAGITINSSLSDFDPRQKGKLIYVNDGTGSRPYTLGKRRGDWNPFAEQTVQLDPVNGGSTYYLPYDEQHRYGLNYVTYHKPRWWGLPYSTEFAKETQSVSNPEWGGGPYEVAYRTRPVVITQREQPAEYKPDLYNILAAKQGDLPLSAGVRIMYDGQEYTIKSPNYNYREDFKPSKQAILTNRGRSFSVEELRKGMNNGLLAVPDDRPGHENQWIYLTPRIIEPISTEGTSGGGDANRDVLEVIANDTAKAQVIQNFDQDTSGLANILRELEQEQLELDQQKYGGVKKFPEGGELTLEQARAQGRKINLQNNPDNKFTVYQVGNTQYIFLTESGQLVTTKPVSGGGSGNRSNSNGNGNRGGGSGSRNSGEKRNVAVSEDVNDYWANRGITWQGTGIGETRYLDTQPPEEGNPGYYGDASKNTEGFIQAWGEEASSYPELQTLTDSLPNYDNLERNPEVEKFQRWLHDTYIPEKAKEIAARIKEVRGEDIDPSEIETNLRNDYGFDPNARGRKFDGKWGTYTSSRRPLSFDIQPLPPKEEPKEGCDCGDGTYSPDCCPGDIPPGKTTSTPPPYIPPFIQDVMNVSTMPVIKGRNQLIPSWMPRVDAPLMRGPYLDPTNVNANIQASASQAQQMNNQFAGSPSIARAANMRTQAQAANQVAQNVGDVENKNVALAGNYALQNANSLMRSNAFNADLAGKEFLQGAANRDLYNVRAAALDSATTDKWKDLFTNWAAARNISALTDPFILDTNPGGGAYVLRPGAKIDLNQPNYGSNQMTYAEFASDPRFIGMDPKYVQELYKAYITNTMGPQSPQMMATPRSTRAMAAQQAFGNYMNPYPMGMGNAAVGPIGFSKMGGKVSKRRGW